MKSFTTPNSEWEPTGNVSATNIGKWKMGKCPISELAGIWPRMIRNQEPILRKWTVHNSKPISKLGVSIATLDCQTVSSFDSSDILQDLISSTPPGCLGYVLVVQGPSIANSEIVQFWLVDRKVAWEWHTTFVRNRCFFPIFSPQLLEYRGVVPGK